ncbi:MAG: ATP-binding protein [Desulfococcaceae bacterium]
MADFAESKKEIKSILLFSSLILAGLAGNYFVFSIVNAHFVFGSMFAMLVLQIFGPAKGIAAAFFISSYTWFAWNHPNALITMTGEMIFVVWLLSRTRVHLVMADLFYWVFAGIPIGCLCFHFISGMPVSNALFLVSKQALNGIANALSARLLFALYSVHSKTVYISFREILSNLMAFFVLITAIIMLTISSRTDLTETDRQIRAALIQNSLRITHSLENWLEDRKHSIVHLAEMAAGLSPEQMQAGMDQMRMSDSNFLRIALIDKYGITTAYSPLKDDLGRSNIGKDFSDRPYIPVLKQNLQPMLSEVMFSRAVNPEPVAIMLAPLISDGKYAGAMGGILNFDRIKNVLDINTGGHDIFYTLTDKHSHVILSTRSDQQAMSSFSRGNGSVHAADEWISRWIPDLPSNTSTIDLWRKSLYIAESAIGNLSEWKLILEQPVEPFQKKLYGTYTRRFAVLFLILLVLMALAEFLSRHVLASTENLSRLTLGLPARIAEKDSIAWPESTILETNRLIQNFRQMTDLVRAKFSEIRQLNESLEHRVLERTEDLRKSEQSLAITLNSIGDGVIATDTEGRITRMNPVAEHLTGWKFSEAKDRELAEVFRIVNAETRSPVENPVKIVLEKGKTVGLANHTMLISRDEKQYHIADSAAPIRDGSGSVRGVILIFSDVTQRYEAEKENQKLQNQLIQAQKMESVGRLAGGVAHDMNNMLSIIIGYAEMGMSSIPETDPLYPNMQEILRAGKKSADVVRQLLAFARKQAIDPKILNLSDAVSGMLKMLSRLIGENIDLLWKPADDLWSVKMDPAQVDQILANLVVNARDAIKDVGKITIETANAVFDEEYCRDHSGFQPGDYVMLAVSDNGCGMDKETQTNIFEPFFTTKSLGKGTGLGLATIYGIVRQNQGFVNVYSEPGKGSTFRIYIPRSSASETDAKQKSLLEPAEIGTETVLLVEDEVLLMNLCKVMVLRTGYHVLTANSPAEAMRIAKEYKGEIHLLLTDVIMPEMNGKELARHLQIIHPGLRCLFMSGYTANVIVHHGVLEKGIHFIQKPFSARELGVKIREVLKTSKTVCNE